MSTLQTRCVRLPIRFLSFSPHTRSIVDIRASRNCWIYIHTYIGKEREIEGLTPEMSQIEDVKKRVEEKEGILPAQQRLIYAGKQM
jgi:hypothetical protein